VFPKPHNACRTLVEKTLGYIHILKNIGVDLRKILKRILQGGWCDVMGYIQMA